MKFSVPFAQPIILSILLLIFQSSPVHASATKKIEQQINIIDQEYSNNTTAYKPNDNSLGLISWDETKFNGEAVYFEAVLFCGGCSGGNASAQAGLFTEAGAAVTSANVSTISPTYVRVRSADISQNLVDGTNYTVQLLTDATSGTSFLKAARLVIVQAGTQITQTQTQIEIGDNTTTTANAYQVLTNPKIYRWDANKHSAVTNIYFEATIANSHVSGVTSAALSSSPTCATTVTNSEITTTGSTWSLIQSGDISGNLTDDTDYWVCLKTSGTWTAEMANAKLVINQSDTNSINNIELVHQYLNTVATDTDNSFTLQNALNQFNPQNFEGDFEYYNFEADLYTSATELAKARLFNTASISEVTLSEVSTYTTQANITQSRNRSTDLRTYLPPTDATTLDVQLANGAFDTSTVTNAWLVIEINETPDPSLTFSVSGVSANTQNNGITTSVTSTFDTLPFGNLTPLIPRYAAHELYAQTNAATGYSVTMKMLNYMQGNYPANNIDPFTSSWSTPVLWSEPNGTSPNNNTGWIGANTTDSRVPGWDSALEKFGPVNSSANMVMYSSGADAGTTVYITYAVEVNIFQPADLYHGSVVYNITPTY